METRSNHVLVGSVVLILLAVLALFTVWIARLNGADEKEYDIFFKQAVDGIAKGSPVGYSGVPTGQVKEIALWKPDPQFVRVRIVVNADTPILEGTTATIQGIGFTGVSQIQLDGGKKGQPAIKCPEVEPKSACPYGVPVIPTRQGGLGAILSSAPQLLERLSTLTERLTETLSDENQKSITGILRNTDRLTGALAQRAPEIAATLAEAKIAVKQAGDAAEKFGVLADTTNTLIADDVRPTLRNLNTAIQSTNRSMKALEEALVEAKPGVQTLSRQTIPEANQLIRDLRQMSQALTAVAEKLDQGGAGALVGGPRLPDYKPSGSRRLGDSGSEEGNRP